VSSLIHTGLRLESSRESPKRDSNRESSRESTALLKYFFTKKFARMLSIAFTVQQWVIFADKRSESSWLFLSYLTIQFNNLLVSAPMNNFVTFGA